MISHKQKMLNDMLQNINHFIKQNPELEALMIYAYKAESGTRKVDAAICGNNETAHDFGHGLANLSKVQPTIFADIMGGLACAMIGEDLLKVIQSQTKTETCH